LLIFLLLGLQTHSFFTDGPASVPKCTGTFFPRNLLSCFPHCLPINYLSDPRSLFHFWKLLFEFSWMHSVCHTGQAVHSLLLPAFCECPLLVSFPLALPLAVKIKCLFFFFLFRSVESRAASFFSRFLSKSEFLFCFS